jgi:hypothetical protein
MNRSPHGLRPALRYQGLRYARTFDEAFRTARYGAAIEGPWRRPIWARLMSAFWSYWRWC